jgi:rhodanese-related sulfurtransferase
MKSTFFLIALAVLVSLTNVHHAFGQASLSMVEKIIESQYAIPHLSVRQLAALLHSKDSADIILFDVREPPEYAVSHIHGAVSVVPSMSQAEFTRLYGSSIRKKRVVLYCSVGKRSSDLATKIQAAAASCGAVSVENLRGGIFRWYNDGYAVENANGVTNTVHPYDSFWGLLVKQRTTSPPSPSQKQ